MSLNRLFDAVEKAKETAQWRAAFGEPQVVEGKTLIPVARVGYGFGLGFGSAGAQPGKKDEAVPEGGGGGGGGMTRPLGVLVVTPERVSFQETVDAGWIAVAAIGLGALFIAQLAKTLRAIFGRKER